ncbi:hypothetical protein HWB76_gp076 [Streptomyces phage Blueeyedbeauty]|uniref:Uncharacterized protein n=1 Tax=Streptomyces phage Blueeyedbeauty TaxID=2250336 RepID=A0A345L222_9CAUD|nr:hypothetical protein HWB76_gp076 [Streptomyces phage Blueeyedbeauty]AXH49324.1 hypothetical protein SEA_BLUEEYEDBEAUTY_217 [Streptomyces phage Blueeyedbeauty]
MPEVYDYDDETGDVEILDDVPEQRTFPDYVFELEFPTR